MMSEGLTLEDECQKNDAGFERGRVQILVQSQTNETTPSFPVCF
jgi:hypothetical protein